MAATGADVEAGALDYLIWSNINPDCNPIAAKSLNALANKYGAEASLTQPIYIINNWLPLANEIAEMLLTFF